MSLPPVVSNPEMCGDRFEETSGEYGSELPHAWDPQLVARNPHQYIEVCRYCGHRKP